MIKRTPEQEECYALLEKEGVAFGKKYTSMLQVLLTDPTSRKAQAANRNSDYNGNRKNGSVSLVDICRPLRYMVEPATFLNEKSPTSFSYKTDQSDKVYRICMGSWGDNVEEPDAIQLAVWLEIQGRIIKDSITKIENAKELEMPVEELKAFFIGMQRDFGRFREAILKLPYLVLPDTFGDKVQRLRKTYIEFKLLLQACALERKPVPEFMILMNLLEQALNHDFSSNREGGLAILLNLKEHLETYFYEKGHFDIFSELRKEVINILNQKEK